MINRELELLEKIKYNDYLRTRRREPAQVYADIIAASCENEDWWYRELIGMQFFCRLQFEYGINRLREAIPVRLTNTKEEYNLMSFPSHDIIIL